MAGAGGSWKRGAFTPSPDKAARTEMRGATDTLLRSTAQVVTARRTSVERDVASGMPGADRVLARLTRYGTLLQEEMTRRGT